MSLHVSFAGSHPPLGQGRRRGARPGTARAALPAVQPPRAGSERRGRHGHRAGGEQAPGRADGRAHRRGKHRRSREACSGSTWTRRRSSGRRGPRGARGRRRGRRRLARGTAAYPALYRGQPGQHDAGRGSHRAPARDPPPGRHGRPSRHRDRARLPAGRHPDGHQPARHQRDQRDADPGPGPGHRAHSGDRAQRQREPARHRQGPGGGLLPLPDQAHQGERVHGDAGRGPGGRGRTDGAGVRRPEAA